MVVATLLSIIIIVTHLKQEAELLLW